jgi:hypothetical protein
LSSLLFILLLCHKTLKSYAFGFFGQACCLLSFVHGLKAVAIEVQYCILPCQASLLLAATKNVVKQGG